jgi:hypothetical protein
MSSKNNNNQQPKPEGWESISTYLIVQPYGGMHGFMNSYGIRHYEEGGYEEARQIINEMKKSDYEAMQENKK